MPTYRIAVIGHTGHGDYGHGIDTVWLDLPQCEIVGIADADEAGRAAAVKRLTTDGGAPPGFADYRELLDKTKPNIVAVCPRHLGEHRDMVVAAAERGAHVYMEKPFCRTLAEADEMIAALNNNKVKLAIAHQTRYSPKLHVVRELIEDGKIGKLLELRGRGKEDASRGGGEDMWVLGSHIFNLMQYFGGEPAKCTARVLWQGKPVAKENVFDGPEGIGPLAGDNIAAMYEFPDGAMGYFNSVRGAGAKGSRFGLQILGSEGCIEVTTGHLSPMTFLGDPLWSPGRSGKTWQPITTAGVGVAEPMKDGGLHGGNLLAVKDLLAAIEEDREPECNAYEARWTIEMIAGVFASHMAGGPVKLPLEKRQNPLAS